MSSLFLFNTAYARLHIITAARALYSLVKQEAVHAIVIEILSTDWLYAYN